MSTKESLSSMKRGALISAALAAGIKSPHATKSSVLVDQILAEQPPSGGVIVALEGEAAPVIELTPEPVQTEIPREVVIEVPAGSTALAKMQRKAFLAQLTAVRRVICTKPTMPVLQCVLLTFGDNRVRMDGTNLDMCVEAAAPAEVAGFGRLAVNASVLADFVSKCSSDYLMAEIKGHKLHISDLENRTVILGIDADEFVPSMVRLGEKPLMTIHGKEFARGIRESLPCASTDASRYFLNGVALNTATSEFVATDGRRLALVKVSTESIMPMGTLIIPSKSAVALAAGVPDDGVAQVTINDAGNRIYVISESNGLSYRSATKLVEGNYPNYVQVLPKYESEPAFKISTEELLSALGRMLVVSEKNKVSIRFKLSGDQFRMEAVNASIGTGEEEITFAGGDKRTVVIAVSGVYLQEIVESWGDEKITFTVKEECSPILLKGSGKLAVIMPVRL